MPWSLSGIRALPVRSRFVYCVSFHFYITCFIDSPASGPKTSSSLLCFIIYCAFECDLLICKVIFCIGYWLLWFKTIPEPFKDISARFTFFLEVGTCYILLDLEFSSNMYFTFISEFGLLTIADVTLLFTFSFIVDGVLFSNP